VKINPKKVIKVDIGTTTPEEGFLSCQLKVKLPFPDNSVTLLSAAHSLEKLPKEKFMKFMDEAWRVLKIDGQFRIAMYYAGSTPFWADPHNVNGLTIQSWNYFDPETMGGALYNKYKPKPWKIQQVFVQKECTMEVLLAKRKA
jgi:hypothetical protein